MKNVSTLGVGSTDIFIEQQPYPSWNVGVNTAEWYPPVGLATVSKDYYWDEPTTSWKNS